MKISSYDIKKTILLAVREKPASYAQLERKVNTGFRTIKQNCEELQHFGQVTIEHETHPSNGKPANLILITDKGLETLKQKK